MPFLTIDVFIPAMFPLNRLAALSPPVVSVPPPVAVMTPDPAMALMVSSRPPRFKVVPVERVKADALGITSEAPNINVPALIVVFPV